MSRAASDPLTHPDVKSALGPIADSAAVKKTAAK